MKRHRRHIVVGVLALVAALPFAQSAVAGPVAPDVPDDIKVGAGNKVFLVGHAVGVQIYSCNGAGAWTLVAPRADLYGDNGKLIVTHFAGPTLAGKGRQQGRGHPRRRVIVDPTAIPWLRLKAAPVSSGGDGDRLAGTTYIQRIATVGGVAPASSTCTAGSAGRRGDPVHGRLLLLEGHRLSAQVANRRRVGG